MYYMFFPHPLFVPHSYNQMQQHALLRRKDFAHSCFVCHEVVISINRGPSENFSLLVLVGERQIYACVALSYAKYVPSSSYSENEPMQRTTISWADFLNKLAGKRL
ncbi:unnamed protein product [Amoebophrya sp. A25]|nr:unnamed protein product [Amoebophrya sp. A25]|eukprot:GSA25T00024615001.1